MDELEALVILSSLPYIGSIKARLLIQHYGSACKALRAPLTELALFPGFGPKVLQAWENGLKQESWRHNLLLVERFHAHLIPFTSSQYPKRLLEVSDYPLVLYVQGALTKEDQRCLAVVGTRQASLYGQEMAKRLSQELAGAGYTIISGLARGIDTAAHQGALTRGRTLAVLGSGLAHIYPSENAGLAQTITQKGALISEFPMTTPPDRPHFPQRNRIVSGMSMGLILIEAPQQSGAMLTVERALGQGRPVFALPGRADLDGFKGNHALIKERKAELVEEAQDICKHFEDFSLPLTFKLTPKPSIALEKDEEIIVQHLATQELSVEELVARLQWPVTKLNVLLMSLVLKKVVKEYPGKIYKKS